MTAARQPVIDNPDYLSQPMDRTLRRARVLELVYEVTRAINSEARGLPGTMVGRPDLPLPKAWSR